MSISRPLRSLEVFGARIERVPALRQALRRAFEDGSFDGVLVWDTLQFLTAPLLQIVVERLHRILRPGSCLLAFFHSEEKIDTIPTYSYRISDHRNIMLVERGRRRPAQFFNNRSLEKLFQEFHSVKFFLTRDHLREVIVRR